MEENKRLIRNFIWIGFFLLPFIQAFADEKALYLTNWEFMEERNGESNCLSENGWKRFSFPGQPPGSNRGKILLQRTTLPAISETETIRFLSVDQFLEVYLNESLVYNVGSPDKPDELTFGNTLHLVKLHKSAKNAVLCFRIFSRTANVGLNGTVSIANQYTHINNLIREEFLKLTLNGIFFIIGIILVSIYFFAQKERGYLFFGLFLLVFSGWFFAQTEIKIFLINNPLIWRILDILCLFQIPVWIVLFNIHIFGKGPWKLSIGFFRFHSTYALVAIPLIYIKPVFLEYIFAPFQVSVILVTIYLMTLSLLTAWKGDYEAKLFFTGMFVLFATGMIDTLGALGMISWSMPTTLWGLGILILFAVIILTRRTVSRKVYSEKVSDANMYAQSLFVILQSKYKITYAEAKICCAIESGTSKAEILHSQNIKDGTFKSHMNSIYGKLLGNKEDNSENKRDKLQRITVFLKKLKSL